MRWRLDLLALAVVAPALWALSDLVITGDPLYSLNATSALAEELGRERGIANVPGNFVAFLADTARPPVFAAALLGAVLAFRARARLHALHVPLALFVAGSRAYLDGCWAERDLARLFLAGGGPPGFELVARRRYREWTARNATLLRHGPDDGVEPWGDALVLVLTTVVSEAGHEVAVCEDAAAASRLAGDVLALIARIGAP